MRISAALRTVLDSMESEPGAWTQTHYTLDNPKLGVKVWVCNGFWFYKLWISPRGSVPFTLGEKFIFHRAHKRWKLRVPLAAS